MRTLKQNFMEPTFFVTQTDFLLNLDGISYTVTWVGEMLKVTGGDICYYLAETSRGLEQLNCTLSDISILIANN